MALSKRQLGDVLDTIEAVERLSENTGVFVKLIRLANDDRGDFAEIYYDEEEHTYAFTELG